MFIIFNFVVLIQLILTAPLFNPPPHTPQRMQIKICSSMIVSWASVILMWFCNFLICRPAFFFIFILHHLPVPGCRPIVRGAVPWPGFRQTSIRILDRGSRTIASINPRPLGHPFPRISPLVNFSPLQPSGGFPRELAPPSLSLKKLVKNSPKANSPLKPPLPPPSHGVARAWAQHAPLPDRPRRRRLAPHHPHLTIWPPATLCGALCGPCAPPTRLNWFCFTILCFHFVPKMESFLHLFFFGVVFVVIVVWCRFAQFF